MVGDHGHFGQACGGRHKDGARVGALANGWQTGVSVDTSRTVEFKAIGFYFGNGSPRSVAKKEAISAGVLLDFERPGLETGRPISPCGCDCRTAFFNRGQAVRGWESGVCIRSDKT